MVARPAGPMLVTGTVTRKRCVVDTGVALPFGCVMTTEPMLKFVKLSPHPKGQSGANGPVLKAMEPPALVAGIW